MTKCICPEMYWRPWIVTAPDGHVRDWGRYSCQCVIPGCPKCDPGVVDAKETTEAPTRTKVCATCRFWAVTSKDKWLRDPEGTAWGMGCHRHGPIGFGAATAMGPNYEGTWPCTYGSDWCGDWEEHQAKEGHLAEPDHP